jgi:hypothetical protein
MEEDKAGGQAGGRPEQDKGGGQAGGRPQLDGSADEK